MVHRTNDVTTLFVLFFALACSPDLTPDEQEAEQYEVVRIIDADFAGDIRDLHVDSGGRIWVLSSSAPFLALLDSSGILQRTRGTSGRGPTDFLYPYLFVAPQARTSGTLSVVDLGRHAVMGIDSMLVPYDSRNLQLIARAMRADMPNILASLPFAASGNGRSLVASAVTRTASSARDFAMQVVLRVHRDTVDTIWRSNVALPDKRRYVQYPLWAACTSAGLIGLDATHRLMVRVSVGGKVDSIPIPGLPARRATTESDARIIARLNIENEFLDNGVIPGAQELDEAVERALPGFVASMSDSLPRFAGIGCSSNAAVWLQEFDVSESPLGAGSHWLRFSDRTRMRVRFPQNFRPMHFDSVFVAGVLVDSLDVPRIAFVTAQ